MKSLVVIAGGITLAAVHTVFAAFAADTAVIKVPGVEIRADGSISAPGVEIGPGGDVQVPGVTIGGGKVSTGGAAGDPESTVDIPGVVIGQGQDGGEGDVVITSDGGTINTAVSSQNLVVKGDDNTLKGAGRF